MHLVPAGVGQQVPVGIPPLAADLPVLDLIAEERRQQGTGKLPLRHRVEPAPEGIDTGQAPQPQHPSSLLRPHVLELFD